MSPSSQVVDPYDLYDSPELIQRIKELYSDDHIAVKDIAYCLNTEYAAEGIELNISQSRVEAHIMRLVDDLEIKKRTSAIASPYHAKILVAAQKHCSESDSAFCALDIYWRIHGIKTKQRGLLPSPRQIATVLENSHDFVELKNQSAHRRERVLYTLKVKSR
ncbi:hypothetical protein [Candidatus Methanomassiliicoccus intestinalis]|jgi:hypothetical protein|uniref:Uncharacterized protein n=1 Tax=Siphoviridae sp. ctedO8 TaxID=2827907 RepID=A0A8S5T343_9CAUD|nr:MAG TPA: hypothetical protein [Siphoviridae sp. ctedO8]